MWLLRVLTSSHVQVLYIAVTSLEGATQLKGAARPTVVGSAHAFKGCSTSMSATHGPHAPKGCIASMSVTHGPCVPKGYNASMSTTH
ncbi:hypothetical protein ACOSQ3_028768 [Xanthoceras sorbifolium]